MSIESSIEPGAPLHDRLRGRDLFRAGRTPIVVNRFVLDGSFHSHDHDFMEIALASNGRGVHCSIHGEQEIREGDVFILRAGWWHAYKRCRGLEIVNCCFGAELLARELSWIFDEPPLSFLLRSGPLALERRGIAALHLKKAQKPHGLELLKSLEEATQDVSIFARAEQVARLLLLLSFLARHTGIEHRTIEEKTPRSHPCVVAAVRVLEDAPQRSWTLHQLASQFHLDRFYFARLFKAQTGLAPMEYLARLRAERAANLLLRTHLSIGEIGANVGWSDPNYFARRFKTHFGLSASEYRRQFTKTD